MLRVSAVLPKQNRTARGEVPNGYGFHAMLVACAHAMLVLLLGFMPCEAVLGCSWLRDALHLAVLFAYLPTCIPTYLPTYQNRLPTYLSVLRCFLPGPAVLLTD